MQLTNTTNGSVFVRAIFRRLASYFRAFCSFCRTTLPKNPKARVRAVLFAMLALILVFVVLASSLFHKTLTSPTDLAKGNSIFEEHVENEEFDGDLESKRQITNPWEIFHKRTKKPLNRLIGHDGYVDHDFAAGNCVNTKQGARLIADSNGAICLRENVGENGCCRVSIDQPCGTCREDLKCCATFEHCTSCCMISDVIDRNERSVQNASILFRDCMSLCRTSPKNTIHGNRYQNPFKHCFSKDEDRFVFASNDVRYVVASTPGQSCVQVCGESQLVCVNNYLSEKNSCQGMREKFSCRSCKSDNRPDRPSLESFAASNVHASNAKRSGACFIQKENSDVDCQGSHPSALRLCACVAPPASI